MPYAVQLCDKLSYASFITHYSTAIIVIASEYHTQRAGFLIRLEPTLEPWLMTMHANESHIICKPVKMKESY